MSFVSNALIMATCLLKIQYTNYICTIVSHYDISLFNAHTHIYPPLPIAVGYKTASLVRLSRVYNYRIKFYC